jgi:hypothetical protein
VLSGQWPEKSWKRDWTLIPDHWPLPLGIG